jgi:hypothetical protein
VLLADPPHLRADLGEGLLPPDPIPPVTGPLLRVEEPVGRRVDLLLVKPLRAREAARGDVLLVGADADDAAVLDVDDETAERLADPAERGVGRDGASGISGG